MRLVVTVLLQLLIFVSPILGHDYDHVCRHLVQFQSFMTGDTIWQRAGTTRNKAWLAMIGNSLGLTDDDLVPPDVTYHEILLKDIPRMSSPSNDSATWNLGVVVAVCQAMHNLVTSGRLPFVHNVHNVDVDFGYSQVWPRIVGVLQQQLVTFKDTLLAFANLLDSRMGRFAAMHSPSYEVMRIAFFMSLNTYIPDVFDALDFSNSMATWPEAFLQSSGHGYFSMPVQTRLMDEFLCAGADRDQFWIRVAVAVLTLCRDTVMDQDLEMGIQITQQMTLEIPGETLIAQLHKIDLGLVGWTMRLSSEQSTGLPKKRHKVTLAKNHFGIGEWRSPAKLLRKCFQAKTTKATGRR
ncbi:Uncharacterized protein PBTT_08039 [Plasmodiophora brassicae]|uniref:Uncharacterized protein n=1 Tax=Plasmodiophora brassicae TaxID=37360 RepID=A0A0G4IK66_PLABS|nr:hypothetical protein PBRA_004342 [Plasmodiophora brassicae]SPR00484.1 unnamed protein product [Plasmodiophora brassicae]